MTAPCRTALVTVGAGLLLAATLTACGGGTTVTTNNESPGDVKISSSAGSVAVGAKVPDGWPSDVPLPTGLEIKNGMNLGTDANKSMSVSYQGSGPTPSPADVEAELTPQFKANGFTALTSFGGGANGGVAVWNKGNTKVQVTIATQDGKTVVNETVIETPANQQ